MPSPATPAMGSPSPHEPHRGPSRRQLLTVAGVGLPLAALYGCGSSGNSPAATSTAPVELSFFYWGTQARADITDKVLKLYTSKHPNVTFKASWQGYSGYSDKLRTMAAGNSAPDLFQTDDNMLSDFTGSGVCLNLKKYLGNKISIDKFPASLKTSGDFKGRTGGIAAAENTPAMYYDKTALAALKIQEPTIGMSWDDLVTWGTSIYTASGGKLFGTMDPSGDYKAFQVYMRQNGKDFYNQDGKFAFAEADLTAWFQFWADAATKKATPPADLIHDANSGDVAKQLVETKKGTTAFMWSNQLSAVQKGTDHQLGMVSYPGDPKGQWARASMYWSAFSGTKHADVVADVINFLVNDPDAGKILGAERGLACNLDVRTAVAPTLGKDDQTSSKFETDLSSKFGSAPAVPPKGHVQVRTLLTQAAESVQYKKATPAAAAANFMKQANAAIS